MVKRFPTSTERVARPNNSVDMLGGIILWDLSENCPANTVEVNGGTIPAQYAALIAKMGTNANRDYQALVPRGIGTQSINARTKTGPTNPGDKQEDQIQGHVHSAPSGATAYVVYKASGGTNTTTGAGSNYDTSANTASPASDGTNGTPRTGAETRVSAFGVKFCRIAASTPVPTVIQGVEYNTEVKSGGMAGTTSIASGAYTPTVTNGSNVSATSVKGCTYLRIGAVTDVSCTIGVTCSVASGTEANIGIAFPIASNITGAFDVTGHVTGNGSVADESGLIYGDTTNKRANGRFRCNITSALIDRVFSFQYQNK